MDLKRIRRCLKGICSASIVTLSYCFTWECLRFLHCNQLSHRRNCTACACLGSLSTAAPGQHAVRTTQVGSNQPCRDGCFCPPHPSQLEAPTLCMCFCAQLNTYFAFRVLLFDAAADAERLRTRCPMSADNPVQSVDNMIAQLVA